VALRNKLHFALTLRYGTATWYDIPLVLGSREQDAVREAKDKLLRDGKPEEPDRLIAELSFGFWTSLLTSSYDRKFWPVLLRPVFPGAKNRERVISLISGRVHSIRRLRNRVFHHEPICVRGAPKLLELYDHILQTIAWLEPEVPQLLPIGDDFREVCGRGPASYAVCTVQ
jgi:hypothetical protein